MDATLATVKRPELIQLGVHFGLDEDDYHRDPALGSSDARNCLLSAPDYWWGSWMNPNPDDPETDDTPAKTRGKAMHKLVLEGEAGFDKLFMRGARHTSDMSGPEKGALTKAANARAAQLGLTALPSKDYDRVAIAAAMITKHPDLKTAFLNGIPEVSIFWLRDGVRCKARIDYLKAGGMGDLKSITNIKKIEFRRACREAIANYRYDIQAAHYLDGRAQLPKLVADGLVYGDHDPALLKRIAAAKSWGFQFVFFQASKAPVTWSTIITPSEQNPIYQVGVRDLELALENYRTFLNDFGTDSIWLLLDKPQELSIEEMPPWYARRG